jgi:predicted metalloprotease with PDZ domain
MRKILLFLISAVSLMLFSDSYSKMSDIQGNSSSDRDSDKNQKILQGKENQNFELNYSIEPFYDINAFRLIVMLEFEGEKSGETQLLMPVSEGEEKPGIKFLKALSEGTAILDTERPEIKIVRYAPGAAVKIYYQIDQTYSGEITTENHYRPIITKRYFHVFSDSFFILPTWDLAKEFSIRIAWNHMPSNWQLANSFGVNQTLQDLKVPLWKFRNAVFAGGDFRILQRFDGSAPLNFAIRGSWSFTDDQICDLSRDIIRGERKFWNEDPSPKLELILPMEGYDTQLAETRSDAISLYLSTAGKIDYRLKQTLACDYFQSWIAGGIIYAEPQQLVYWFQKGFSEYYARLIMLRSGIISLDDYLENFNSVLDQYFTSPVRFEKNERLVKEYWSDPDLRILPSLRGDIFAHNLNYYIIKNSQAGKSLDDLMRDLYHRCRAESLIISNGSLSALIRYYAGDAALAELMRNLNSNGSMKIQPGALGPCFRQEINSYHKFWFLGEYFEVPVFKYTDPGNRTSNCIGWFLIN